MCSIRVSAAAILYQGDRGDEVAVMQELLNLLGYNPGPIDGIFGPLTARALLAFQGDAGLVQDGICGPLTWSALSRSAEVSRASASRALAGKVIVIDPGHGGYDPGAVSWWRDKEKDFTFDIAFKTVQYLRYHGARVIMTRYGDYPPGSDWGWYIDELVARVSIANSNNADVFLSIHVNAYPKNPKVSGVMGFYPQGCSLSRSLAKGIALAVGNQTGLRYIDTQIGSYYVLSNSCMPAALLEVGFMTNYNDVMLLRQNWFRDEIAFGIYKGILEYFN